jgi:hypothetical protein
MQDLAEEQLRPIVLRLEKNTSGRFHLDHLARVRQDGAAGAASLGNTGDVSSPRVWLSVPLQKRGGLA